MGIYIASFAIPALIVLYLANANYFAALDPDSRETISFQVEDGETIEGVARRLEEAEVIKNSSAISFNTKYRMSDEERQALALVAGEYDLSPAMRPADVLARISSGNVVLHRIEIAAGATLNDIADSIAKTGLLSSDDALAALKDPETLRLLEIPAYIPEGFFAPGAYGATRPNKPSQLVVSLLEKSAERRNEDLPDWKSRARELGFEPYDILKLASILEIEADSLEERRNLSSLYHNRLRVDYPMNSLSAARYPLDPDSEQKSEEELREEEGPYNTFNASKLPQTPIATPSAESIEAALTPIESDFLYKINIGEKSYDYSFTQAEHQAKVEKYRRELLSDVS